MSTRERGRRYAQCACLFLMVAWGTGCAGLRPVAIPADSVPKPTQAGFHSVYDGELRIWFHSFRAIWYVAVEPADARLAVAVINPAGLKIMQMHGTGPRPESVVTLPPAKRLQPYGEALWEALWWSVAGSDLVRESGWTQRGNRLEARVTRDNVQARFRVCAVGGGLERVDVREGWRRLYTILLENPQGEDGWSGPGLVRVRSFRPRCRLVLTLKNIQWSEEEGEHTHGTEP
jgi:hypothetical protein